MTIKTFPIMRVALIGYGRMGHEIESVLKQRGHEVVVIIDKDNLEDLNAVNFKGIDAAIEFTTPKTAKDNIKKCLDLGVPVVCGTTGWNDGLNDVRTLCENVGGTFFYSSNFSLGVNVFFELNRYLARIMDSLTDYDVSMTEIHHTRKLDAPSGTAITLAETVLENIDRKSSWANNVDTADDVLNITSLREGDVPGTHSVRYDSEYDNIEIIHAAKSRLGFALGVVLAAEFTQDHKGVLSMSDMLEF